MSHRRWFRPVLAGLALWALLQACGSDHAGPGPAGMDGGNGPDGQAGAGDVPSSHAGNTNGAEGGTATAGMSAAGEGQGGGPPILPDGTGLRLAAAVGAGRGATHQVRIRLGGPQSGRGDGIKVSVKVGKP